MEKDLKNFNSDNPNEIRAVLGPLDDPKDSELYLVRLPQSEEEEREQDLRMQYNMSVRAKREVARMQAKGIYNEKGQLIVSSNPFEQVSLDDIAERCGAAEWILSVLRSENVSITPETTRDILEAINILASAQVNQRTMTEFCNLLEARNSELGAVLKRYIQRGPFYGHVFDAQIGEHEAGIFVERSNKKKATSKIDEETSLKKK